MAFLYPVVHNNNMVSQILDSPNAIIKKIIDKGLSEQEVQDKIRKKQDEYGGLLTEAGAAYSIAKGLGIDFEFEPKSEIKIKELSDGLNNVNLSVKIEGCYPTREFEKDGRKGTITNLIVSDETGRTSLAVWNKDKTVIDKLKKGSLIKILNGYARERNGQIEIQVGTIGNVSVLEPGRDERAKVKDLQDNSFAEIRATVVDIYKPTILEVCPVCGSMLKPDCPKCGKTETAYSLIVNAELDDGTDVVRGTFYRQMGEKFLGLSGKELKENPSRFDERKRRLLGEEYVFMGETKTDTNFNRMNFIVRSFNNMDVQKELARVG